MDLNHVATRRQELKEEAYYLVLKALVLNNKPDMTLLARLRLELSIGTDSHKQWMTALLNAKQAGTLGMHIDDRPGFGRLQGVGGAAVVTAAVAPIAAAAAPIPTRSASRQQQLQQQQQSLQQPVQSTQGTTRAKAKAKPPEPENELPLDPLHLKVQYYKTTDGWAEGVITEYNAALKKIRVNVLQTKKVEWLDYVPSPCLIVHANARVTDLTPYV